jgi:hypothetical protein
MALEDGVTTSVARAGGVVLAIICGEMPTVHSSVLENCRFPRAASLNEDDGWFYRTLKPSIVSRLRERLSRVAGRPPELLFVLASIGCAAIAAGAFIALCVLATKALTGAAEVFGERCLLRLSSLLIQTGPILVGMDYWPAWSGECS